jgi:hypothetical protein
MIHNHPFGLLVWSLMCVGAGFFLTCYWLAKLGYRGLVVNCYDCGGAVGTLGMTLVSRNTCEVLCDNCLNPDGVPEELLAAGMPYHRPQELVPPRDERGLEDEELRGWCDVCNAETAQIWLGPKLGCLGRDHATIGPRVKERDPACAGPLPGVVLQSCDHKREQK